MKKIDRITRVRNDLTEDDLIRLLPEIELIVDDDIREKTKRVFLYGAPDYFWELPSSSTGKYHPVDETKRHGNLLHTKRVFVTYLVLSRSFKQMGMITDQEREYGKSAALLHDMVKYGWPSEQNDHTTRDHDVLGAAFAQRFGDLPDEVVGMIDAHNGGWADGKDPENDLELLLHLSDYVSAARILGNPHIIDPSEELVEQFDNLDVIGEERVEELI